MACVEMCRGWGLPKASLDRPAQELEEDSPLGFTSPTII